MTDTQTQPAVATRVPGPRVAVVVLAIVAVVLAGLGAFAGYEWRMTAAELEASQLEAIELEIQVIELESRVDSLSASLDVCKFARDSGVDWASSAQSDVDSLRDWGDWEWLDYVEQALGYAVDVDECDAPDDIE